MVPGYFFIFIDTSIIYNSGFNYNAFNNRPINELLEIRNNYNGFYKEYKEILLHIPEIVMKELLYVKNQTAEMKLGEAEKILKPLEEETLNKELNEIKKKFSAKISSEGEIFLRRNNIIKVPCCSDHYFDYIVQKAIDKKKPFHPSYDAKNDKQKGDNGFKDTLIWYSIIEYMKKKKIKNTDQIIFLTNNIKDFESEDTLQEFKSLTGKEIHIVNFNSNNIGKPNDSTSQEFFTIILENSKDFKIDTIKISYIELKDEIKISSIKSFPLGFNISPLFPESLTHDDFKEKIEKSIKDKFLSFGFSVENLKFTYTVEPKIVGVNVFLRNYKLWFIDILGMELEFEDDTFIDEYNFDTQFSTEIEEYRNYPFYGDSEGLQVLKEIQKDFRETIAAMLKKRGYHVDPDVIDYEFEEFIPPD